MYSRNLTLNNTARSATVIPSYRGNINEGRKESIPVKSFKDDFAYERFNSLGNTTPAKELDVSSGTADILADNSEFFNKDRRENIESNSSDTAIINTDATQNKNEILPLSVLLRKFADADTLLICFLVIFIMLSDNTTNDKLTPLALLAILLI